MDATMTAIVAEDYGPPESLVVKRIPVPQPGPGQIQVRVRASALNPGELRTLGGAMHEQAPLRFPHVPGGDFAGTVTRIGTGVTRFGVGDEIFGFGLPRAQAGFAALVSDPPSLTSGTMAEYAVFEAETPALAHRPAALAAEHAAALPTAGLTALTLLRNARVRTDDTVLVIGATGGVGSIILPLLAAGGAHVIATATSGDEQYVRLLGAAEVLDYRAGDLAAQTLRSHPGGVAVLLNLAHPTADLTAPARAIQTGGRLLNIVYPAPDPAAFDRIELHTLLSRAEPGDLETLARQAVNGTLPHIIESRYRLTEAPKAFHDLAHRHTRGKLVVTVHPD